MNLITFNLNHWKQLHGCNWLNNCTGSQSIRLDLKIWFELSHNSNPHLLIIKLSKNIYISNYKKKKRRRRGWYNYKSTARMHRYGNFGRVPAPGTSGVWVRVPYGYKGTQHVPKGKIEISKIWVCMGTWGVRMGIVWVRILGKTV